MIKWQSHGTNETSYPGLSPGTDKGYQWKSGNPNRVYSYSPVV